MPDLIAAIMTRYRNFAITGDGIAEIASLSYLAMEADFPDPTPDQRLALVLVEPRLLEARGDPELKAVFERGLRRLKSDLRAEGLVTRFIEADVYQGPVQKDGRIVLALRQFLRDIKACFASFEGVLLVGNFPDSSIVRTVAWAPGFSNPTVLAIWPELISSRADIVLGDLTGSWEALYHQDDFRLESISALPDDDTTARGWYDGESVRDVEFGAASYQSNGVTFRDAFYLDDAIVDFTERTGTTLRATLHRAERNLEVSTVDRTLTNVIAKPDIAVSRINARHVAVNPDPTLVGSDGHHFLDATGQPQAVASTTPLFAEPEVDNLFNFLDIDLERRLINEYLDRNHRFRTGAFASLAFRVAAISGTPDFTPDYYAQMMGNAATDFAPAVLVPDATVVDYVNFLKTPAVLKYVMAHSTPRMSAFRNDGNDAGLAAAVGGPPARWIYDGQVYRTIYDGQSGICDLIVHRALWQNSTLKDAGAMLAVHGGCDVNTVEQAQDETYAAPTYAHWSNSEAMLFFTNCVALLSRAKGFNDAPDGFADGFRSSDRANISNCWRSYFDAQARQPALSVYNIQRKRAYFWSIHGDWSLRLRNRNGIGIVGLDGPLVSKAVHPDRAWVDGWNFDAAINPIRGIADLDGNGVDEYVVTSDWGIGILKHDGVSFRVLMQAPRDTWFGGWRWDATVNVGRDEIKVVADFSGGGRAEILVWSSWGLATLAYRGGTLNTSSIYGNGSRIAGWLLDTGGNTYCGHGRFVTGSAASQMVITSQWGMGILSLTDGTEPFAAANGSRLGDWLLGTDNNRIQLVADLDGDGYDEIVITSPWGLGILKMVGGTLHSIALHPNGDDIGGYVLNSNDSFTVADRLTGRAQHQIVVANGTGLHVLALTGARLVRIAFAANGSRIDGWLVGTDVNQLQAAGDLKGDGRACLIIRSPWGVGVLTLGDDFVWHGQALSAFGSLLGDWNLEPGDRIVGAGRLSSVTPHRALLLTKA